MLAKSQLLIYVEGKVQLLIVKIHVLFRFRTKLHSPIVDQIIDPIQGLLLLNDMIINDSN